jgi:hypothetical protein
LLWVVKNIPLHNDYNVKIDKINLKVKDGVIYIPSITLQNKNFSVTAQELTVKYKLISLLQFVVSLDVVANNIVSNFHNADTQDNLKIKQLKVSGDYNFIARAGYGVFNLAYTDQVNSLGNFKLARNFLNITDYDFYTNQKKEFSINLALKFNDDYSIHSLESSGYIDKLSLVQHKFLNIAVVDSYSRLLLQNLLLAGEIYNSTWEIKLSSKFFSNYQITETDLIKGTLYTKDVKVAYHEEFPTLDNISGKINLDRALIVCDISHATSVTSKIIDTKAILNLENTNLPILQIIGRSEGPAFDLLSFIPRSKKQKLLKSKLDLSKFEGRALTQFDIKVPLDLAIPNEYDVKAQVASGKLSLIKGYELDKVRMKGYMDSNSVNFDVDGVLLAQKIHAQYRYVFKDIIPFEHFLKVNMPIVSNSSNEYKSIDIKSGKGNLKMDVSLNEVDNGKISLIGNFTNNLINLSKLGITKPADKQVIVKAQGIIDKFNLQRINFTMQGDDQLDVKGFVDIIDDDMSVTLDKVTYLNNILQGKIINTKTISKLTLGGEQLDLSQIDFSRFITRQSNKSGVTDIKVKKVQLKSDVHLSNLEFHLSCDAIKCNSGSLLADLESPKSNDYVSMNLTSYDNHEIWSVHSNNLGELLKGTGLYSGINKGNVSLILKTSRKDTNIGNIIPIIDGTFNVTKFSTADVSFATTVISMTSFTGLFTMISNKNLIPFNKMEGNFSLQGGNLHISSAAAEGYYFDFTMNGDIDTINRKIKLKGTVVPSLYGINIMARKIPLFGKLFSSGHNNGIIFAPYSVNKQY